MAALSAPPTPWAVSLLASSLVGFCLCFIRAIYHCSLCTVSIQIVFTARHYNSRLCCTNPLICLHTCKGPGPIGCMVALWSYKSFVDLINPHKRNVMVWKEEGVIQPRFLVCYEYFSDHCVYEMSLRFHHQGERCDVDPLVIYTSLRPSALSIIRAEQRAFSRASWHKKPRWSGMCHATISSRPPYCSIFRGRSRADPLRARHNADLG